MTPGHPERSLGDYRLLELQQEDELSWLWRAEQRSVSRRVLVRELRPEQAARKQEFLAEIRAKAAVDHPLIGTVYEAVDQGGRCYSAHEWLAGETLDSHLQRGLTLSPAELVQIIARLADTQLHHEAAAQATKPLELRHIHLDQQHGVVRIENLATAGTRATGQSESDIMRLGKAMVPLVAKEQPGTNRMLCLLGWMRGEEIGAPLTWRQIHKLCQQIEQQLAQAATDGVSLGRASTRLLRRDRRRHVIAGAAIAFALVLLLAWLLRPGSPPADVPRPLPDFIRVPAGSYPSFDGPARATVAFLISPHEVTIGQYAEFLEALESLKPAKLERTYDHPEQAPEKSSHQPDDWPELLAAAKNSETWQNHRVTLDTPVVGVDWWDAVAYADWKQARLPSQHEWLAALHAQSSEPAAIPPSGWQAVTEDSPDRTRGGLHGMAGSVCEWTASSGIDPANPLGGRKWIIAGGSFRKPGSHAMMREWADDRSLRRPDLGFRIVSDAR